MIEFSDLQIVHKVDDKEYLLMKKRYVLGAEPCEQKGVLSGVNVFTIYDRTNMRIVSKTVTVKPFEHWLDWVLRVNEKTEMRIRKSECKISKKFINYDGSATNPNQIRR